ncbi:sortase domain-bontaining protein [Kitasatospora sp. NPDC001540]|uniref:sortase domain-containing protein n=1 Tax=Kitasatospora sp. NPDC001540 TaxID=3364014 RepID=UPI0036B71D40
MDLLVRPGRQVDELLRSGPAAGRSRRAATRRTAPAGRGPAAAARRNGHGEPFRYLNRLEPGDLVVLRTPTAVHTYALDRELPETDADNYAALDPVPAQADYTSPGHYLTLTTRTPEFTSLHRLVRWGHLTATTPPSD